MEHTAIAKYKKIAISPRKARLVVNLIRHMDLQHALHTLKHLPHKAAPYVAKVLQSAIGNLEYKQSGKKILRKDIRIQEIYVDQGSVLKRIQPAPQGRAHPIRKPQAHITVKLVATIEATKTPTDAKATTKPKSKTKAEATTKSKVETKANIAAKAESKTKGNAKIKMEAKATSKATEKPKAKPETATKAKPKAAAKTKSQSATKTKATTKSKSTTSSAKKPTKGNSSPKA